MNGTTTLLIEREVDIHFDRDPGQNGTRFEPGFPETIQVTATFKGEPIKLTDAENKEAIKLIRAGLRKEKR